MIVFSYLVEKQGADLDNLSVDSITYKDKNTNASNSTNELNNGNFNLKGSVFKKLDPARVVKLWADGYCFGYYYIDVKQASENKRGTGYGEPSGTQYTNNIINYSLLLKK